MGNCEFCNGAELLGEAEDERDTARRELEEAQTEIDALKGRVRDMEQRILHATRELKGI